MNIETNRLNTFNNWPSSAPVDPIRIAKAGFFYTGEGTEVQCFSCGGKISEWNYGDQVMSRHRQMEPRCDFVLNPQFTSNVPLVLGRECPNIDTSSVTVSEELPDSTQPTDDYGLREEDDMYKSDPLRLLSFINWEDTTVSRETLVNAGFYHAGEGRLRCAWCGGELTPFRNFGSLGHPLEVHRMYFPRCSHAAALEVAQRTTNLSSISYVPSVPSPPIQSPSIQSPQIQSPLIQSPLTQSPPDTTNHPPQSTGAAHNERLLRGGGGGGAGGAGGTWRALGVVGGGARHAGRAALAARLATFERWPTDRAQTPRALADAGFFYTGTDDQVRCFYCDGGLGKWEAGDAPWCEHARWFPHCGYVLLVKGQQFVDSCRATATASPTEAENGVRAPRRRGQGVEFSVSAAQMGAWMESEPALAALRAGLDAARVQRALLNRLRATGLPYSSSEALIDAVLNEQLSEEPWGSSPQSRRLARDILAETLRDFAPTAGIIPTFQDDSSDRRRSHSESPPSPAPATRAPSIPNLIHFEEPDTTNSSIASDSSRSEPSAGGRRENKRDGERLPSPVPEKKELTLEEENRQLKEARLCKVCMDSEVSVVFLPCGHLVSCGGCGAALSACPLCRCAVRALVRAYLA